MEQNENLLHFDPVFDYKRLEDGDEGPNTGSMGAVLLDYESQKSVIGLDLITKARKVNEEVISELNKKTGQKYKGIIYGSFIITTAGLKIIEYNYRFGDPEGALVLQNVDNDLISLFAHVQTNTLNKVFIKSKN